MTEPLLTDIDHEAWRKWSRVCKMWARTTKHKWRVLKAKKTIASFVELCERPYIGLSGGKDSVALAAIARDIGVRLTVSQRDDFDFPGQTEHVEAVARSLDLDLHIIRPKISVVGWLKAARLPLDADIHSSTAQLSKDVFYGLIKSWTKDQGADGAILGLRKGESHGRLMNRITHGLIYERKDGMKICQPIADFEPIDVYAVILSRDLPLLPLYKAIGFKPEEPWRLREGWPVHATAGRWGYYTWLKLYYPSMYATVVDIFPEAKFY